MTWGQLRINWMRAYLSTAKETWLGDQRNVLVSASRSTTRHFFKEASPNPRPPSPIRRTSFFHTPYADAFSDGARRNAPPGYHLFGIQKRSMLRGTRPHPPSCSPLFFAFTTRFPFTVTAAGEERRRLCGRERKKCRSFLFLISHLVLLFRSPLTATILDPFTSPTSFAGVPAGWFLDAMPRWQPNVRSEAGGRTIPQTSARIFLESRPIGCAEGWRVIPRVFAACEVWIASGDDIGGAVSEMD